MKTLFRLSLISLAVLVVMGATLATLQVSAVQNLLPTRGGERTRPGFNQNFNNDFNAGQRPPAFDGNREDFGRGERDGGGWRGFGTIIKNLIIFGLMFAAAVGLSTFITRWRANAARQPPTQEPKA
jgi:hypothetical protein